MTPLAPALFSARSRYVVLPRAPPPGLSATSARMIGLRRRARPADAAGWAGAGSPIIAFLKRCFMPQARLAMSSDRADAALVLTLRAVTTAVRPFLGESE